LQICQKFLLIIFSSFLFTCANADSFLPDKPNSNIMGANDTLMNSNRLKNNTQNSKIFYGYDKNDTVLKEYKKIDINSTQNKYGRYKSSVEVNSSDVSSLKGYSDSMQGKYSDMGKGLFQSLSKDVGGVDLSNPKSITQSYILEHDKNSSGAQAIDYNQKFAKKVRSLIANLKTVKCYITRKLVNSYSCPLPSKNNSFFIGGNVNDDKNEALASCNNLCQEQSTCLHKDLHKPIKVVQSNTQEIDGNNVVKIVTDDTMLGSFVQIDLNNKYKYDDNISVDSKDYNASKALEALKASQHYVTINMYYLDDNNTYQPVFTNFSIAINDINSSVKIYTNNIRTKGYKITFFKPYLLNKNTLQNESDNRLKVTLDHTSMNYIGNQLWFCPSINFTKTATNCSGIVKVLSIGSQTYNVCITEAGQAREPVYGAFYTEEQCKSQCVIKKECVPTYRHLANYNPYSLPKSLKDVEVGCVKDPSNTSCTKQICMDLFLKDTMPLDEKTWNNDDEIIYTVKNKSAVPNTERPRIDLLDDMSANGDEKARKLASIKEMSEISYKNMIKNGNYNVSALPIENNIPFVNKVEKTDGPNGFGIIWHLKENSFDYDNGKTYYFYSLLVVDSVFSPLYGTYETNFGTVSASLDSGIQIKDRTFIVKTANGFNVVKKILNYQAKLPAIDLNGNTVYDWRSIDALIENEIGMFNGIGFSSYDVNSPAPYIQSKQISSEFEYESFPIFNSFSQLSAIPGLLMQSQKSQGNGSSFTRVYSGPVDDSSSSILRDVSVYGFYSDKKLSYQELFDLSANNRYLVYSTLEDVNKNKISDGLYTLPNIKMYVEGKPEKMSVHVDINPYLNEEGKRAFIYMLLFDRNNTK